MAKDTVFVPLKREDGGGIQTDLHHHASGQACGASAAPAGDFFCMNVAADTPFARFPLASARRRFGNDARYAGEERHTARR